MRKLRPGLFRLSIAVLGLGALAAGPAVAVTSPFSVTDTFPVCSDSGSGTVCTYEVGPVPAGSRWQIYMVACRNNLLSTTATEIATLVISSPNGLVVRSYPILPVKLTNNGFTISQLISVPASANRKVKVTVQSLGAEIVGIGTFCTLSGNQFTPP